MLPNIERAMVPIPCHVFLPFNPLPVNRSNGALITDSRGEERLARKRGYLDDAALLLEAALRPGIHKLLSDSTPNFPCDVSREIGETEAFFLESA